MNPLVSILNHRIARYLVSGAVAAATNLALLYGLTEFAGLWYVASSMIAVSVATVVSFVLQKIWTFENFSTAVHTQFPMHVTLGLSNIFLNSLFLYALVEYAGLWYIAAQIVTGIFISSGNYLVMKHVIFRQEPAV